MNQFDLLIVPNLVLLLVALIRQRPVAFMFFSNQLIVLRAFSNFADFGHPPTLRFLPGALFSTQALDTAGIVFLVATCISVIMVVLPPARPNPDHARELPAIPTWINWALAAYFVAYFFSTKTIFTGSYGVEGFINFSLELSGFTVLMQGLVLYELRRRVVVGSLARWKAYGFLVLFTTLLHFVRGQTGFAAGFLVAGAFVLLSVPGRRVRTSINIAVAAVLCVVAVVLVRGIRQEFHYRGLETVDAVAESASNAEEMRAQTSQGVEGHTNGTQYAAHVLMCIKLFDSGRSRDWRSITDSIVYTLQPSFLQQPLGFERSVDAPLELKSNFIHGGGIYLLGDLYWNGGLLCVALVMLLVSIWVAVVDARFRSSFWWLMLMCMFAPPALMGIGYGFNHFARG
ncbi:MAG: hypothetical protein IT379_17825, partial [Deltaproteobacteria bacterium]|nr:hypothetical protein [Deltaproteobacteria bacterium]